MDTSSAATLPRVEGTLTNAAGVELVTSRWPLPGGRPPSAAILFVPGYNHYASPFYDWFAARLAIVNVACYSIDLESFGRSVGLRRVNPLRAITSCCRGTLRAYVTDFESLVADTVQYIREIKKALPPGMLLFLHGESMGGGISSLIAARLPGLIAGAVLVAPMARLNKGTQPPAWLQTVGSIAATILPWAPLAPVNDISPLCFKDPVKLHEVMSGADKNRYLGRMRLATAFQLRDAPVTIQQAIPSIRCPLLIQQGTSDMVTPAAGESVFDNATACTDRTLVLYTNAWHAMFAEPVETRKRLVMDLISWMSERVPAVQARVAEANLWPDLPPMPVGVATQRRPEGTGPFRDDSVWSASHTAISAAVKDSLSHLD